MPGGFPISYGQANFNDQGTSTSTTKGTTITASGSTNTKGSYAQLVASTPYDAFGFYVVLGLSTQSNNGVGILVDIAVGAAASEVVIVPNISACFTTGSHSSISLYCPVGIPAGSRIAGRCQSSTASAIMSISVILLDGSFGSAMSLGVPQNYGALTGTSVGTSIDPGGSANTKGSWVQLTASSTYDIGAVQLIFDSLKSTSNGDCLFDIGVGAGGSEVVVISNFQIASLSGNSNIYSALPNLFAVNIPAGSRIAARSQSTNITSGQRQWGLSLLGYQL